MMREYDSAFGLSVYERYPSLCGHGSIATLALRIHRSMSRSTQTLVIGQVRSATRRGLCAKVEWELVDEDMRAYAWETQQ